MYDPQEPNWPGAEVQGSPRVWGMEQELCGGQIQLESQYATEGLGDQSKQLSFSQFQFLHQ